MLYYLHLLTDLFSPLRVFRYITFRALAAAGTAFVLSVWIGPWLIAALRRYKIGQHVRRGDAPILDAIHGRKQGTPTMGGVLIIVTVLLSALLWAHTTSLYVWLAAGTMVCMGLIGFWDDYLKLSRKHSKGLSARQKLAWQGVWTLAVFWVLHEFPATREHVRQLMVPFLKDPVIADMGLVGSFLFFWLVLAGATNAVNLTDGLDGLAIGCNNSVAGAYLLMAYAAGHVGFAQYLQVPHIQGGGELAVFCGCLLGAGLGFLWFNCHPASVFMGDTGSLALGGAIAMVAILIKQELALIIVGGVFVMEAMSVVLQVGYFKLTKGKRIFRCAPLHHHFEYLERDRAEKEQRSAGSIETTITIRFWILSIVFALIGVATLKLR